MENVYKEAKEFLDTIYDTIPTYDDRPFVTLTFAQSLDGKIAKKGQQVLLSGKESMAMTHRSRGKRKIDVLKKRIKKKRTDYVYFMMEYL